MPSAAQIWRTQPAYPLQLNNPLQVDHLFDGAVGQSP